MDLEYRFNPTTTRLYFGLLSIGNRLGWKNPFNATNRSLCELVGCEEKTLIRCRSLLAKSGLITVGRGWKNKPTTITLNEIHWNNDSVNASISDSVSGGNVPVKTSDNTKPKKTKPKKVTPTPTPPSEQLESIFAAYPRRVAKPDAFKAISKAIIKHGYDHVFDKTKQYASVRNSDKNQKVFTPHPSTWFKAERYNDDPSEWVDSERRSSPLDDRRQLELVESEIKSLKERHAFPQPGGGYSWNGVAQRHRDHFKRLIARRDELKPRAMGL